MNNKSKDQLEAAKLIETVSKNVVERNSNELVNLRYTFTLPQKHSPEFEEFIKEAAEIFFNSKGLL
jgi:hypothetical protein